MLESEAPLLVVILSILALAVTRSLLSLAPGVVAAQIAAVSLAVWARRSFPTGAFRVRAAPGGPAIIRSGPYRFLRHPMYTASLLFLWAAILGHPDTWKIAMGIAVTFVVCMRVIVEERLLRARYPDYVEYTRTTKALIPFLV